MLLFNFCISVNVWCILCLMLRLFIPCLNNIKWNIIIPLFILSLLCTLLVHIYSWKCWKYLRHSPHVLRSEDGRTSDVFSPKLICFGIVWLTNITAVLLSVYCDWFPWKFSLLSLVFTLPYTGWVCVSSSSDPESLGSSNVNADELSSSTTSLEDGHNSISSSESSTTPY